MAIYITTEPHNRSLTLDLASLRSSSLLMPSGNNDTQGREHALSASGLVARLTSIDIDGRFQEPGRGDRFVIVSIDNREEWKSKKYSSSSRLHWQEDHRLWLHPSSSIKVEVFRKSRVPGRVRLLGHSSGSVVDFLGSDAAMDLLDDTGVVIAGVKLKVVLSLVSDSAQDTMGRVDAAISRLDDTLFSMISQSADASATVATGAYSSAEAVSSCIPSLGQAFEAVVKIARTFSDTHPILKVSCTVLFSVYEAWKDQLLQDQSVQNLAESLREMVCAANECPDLSVIQGTEDVIEAIGRVSLEIASFIDEYARKPFAVRAVRDALFSDMKTRLESFQARCQNLMAKFGSRINIDTNKMVRQLKDGKLAERYERILQWLKAPDPSRNYNNAREKHQEATGSWFLTGSEFLSWKSSPGSLLWVEGIPGCGKTILCSSSIKDVMDHCATDRSSAVAYFFFDSRDAQEGLQRHEGLVRSLIKQFTLQCTTMPDALENMYGEGHSQPSLGALHDTLRIILGLFKNAYVIIDSLDECPSKPIAHEECSERSKFRSWMKEFNNRDEFKQHTHLLVTSRDERDIRETLEFLGAVDVSVRGESVDEDIRRYLEDKLRTDEELKKWKEKSEDIQATVVSMSQGMFRLAALQLEELRDCHSIRELREQMENLPRSLYDTYDKILSKLSNKHRETAGTFLRWLAFCARPPQLQELAEVICVDFTADPRPRFCPDMRYSPESVLTICSSLIVISVEGEIKLAHMSVKEYLFSSSARKLYSYDINEKMFHSLIAQTCLAYLLQFDTVDLLNENTLGDFPLAPYAAKYWPYHVKSAAEGSTDTLQTLIDTLFLADSDGPFISWIRVHDIDEPWTGVCMTRSPGGSRLYYASLAGLQETSVALLRGGANPNGKGGRYGSALQAAASIGHKQLVQLLLEQGADVHLQGGDYGSALHAAVLTGHEQVVQLLLEHGADTNMRREHGNRGLQTAASVGREELAQLWREQSAHLQGGDGGNALQAAASRGHEQLVRLLLEKGADVNLQGRNGHSALQAAASRGYEQVVRLLLEQGADINLQGGEDGSALQAAASRGHEQIVGLLLEKGADVNLQGRNGGSALQAAASIGHEQLVRLLLEKGTDVNLQGGVHGSALQAAVSIGDEPLVRLMLEKGADVNLQGGVFHGSALQAAAYKGDEQLVRLLLEKGADINMQCGSRGSALHAAAYRGHEQLVRLLLEKGAEPNAPGQLESTLQAARRHQSVVDLLLEFGAEWLDGEERLPDSDRMSRIARGIDLDV